MFGDKQEEEFQEKKARYEDTEIKDTSFLFRYYVLENLHDIFESHAGIRTVDDFRIFFDYLMQNNKMKIQSCLNKIHEFDEDINFFNSLL